MEAGDVGAAALLALELVCLGAAAWRVAGRLTTDVVDRSVVALVTSLGATCALLLGLGSIGLLSRVPVAVGVVLISGAVLQRTRPSPSTRLRLAGLDAGATTALAVAVAAVSLTLFVGLRGSSEEVDTRQYHAPNAGFWLATGDLKELPPAVPGYATNAYPSNHTLTALFLMLPTGSDELAYSINAAWAALIICASASAARGLGGRAATGAIIGAAFVLAPVSFHTHANSLMNDWAAAGGTLAALALVLRMRTADTPVPWAGLAGVAAGLAAGSKYTGFVPAAAALVAIPFLAPSTRRTRCVLAGGAGAALLTIFWLLRNALLLDNPLYPLEVGPLRGSASPLNELRTTVLDHVLAGRADVVRRWLALSLDLYGPLAIVVPLGVAVAVMMRRRVGTVTTTAAIAVVSALAYVLTPTTGGGPEGIPFLLASQLRYAMPAVAVGGALVAALLPRGWWWISLLLLAHPVVQVVRGPGYRDDVDLSLPVVAGVALAVVAVGVFLVQPVSARAVSAGAFAVAFAAGVAAFVLQGDGPPTAVERLLPSGGTVAVVQVLDVRALMGEDFRLRIVAPPGDAIREADALDEALERLDADVVAVGDGETVLKPRGWDGPTGWRLAGKSRGVRLWVRP